MHVKTRYTNKYPESVHFSNISYCFGFYANELNRLFWHLRKEFRNKQTHNLFFFFYNSAPKNKHKHMHGKRDT